MDSTDVSGLNEILAKWHGVSAQIWQYSRSLTRMVLRIHREAQRDELYLLGVSCVYTSGPFRWEESRIEVFEENYSNDEQTAIHVVRDLRSKFELRCNGVVLIRSTMVDFMLDKDGEEDGKMEILAFV